MSVVINELVLHGDLTGIVLISDVEHELAIAHATTEPPLTLLLRILWQSKGPLLVHATLAGPLPAKCAILGVLLRGQVFLAGMTLRAALDDVFLGGC
jgi:hypothetical protein